MPSLATKPSSIALFPTAADRSTLIPSAYQQHYLSPPLTPYPHFPLSLEKSPVTSPVSPYPQLPAFREMLPHENRQQQQPSPTDAEHFVYPTSAPSQPSGRQVQDLIEPNPIATYHSGQHMNDPTRLLPLYASHSPQIVTQTPPIVSPILRRNKAHVASACVNCKKAHLACDANRPCRRCVSLDKQDSCVDVQHKRRGRPRLKDSTPSAANTQSAADHRRPSYLHRHISADDEWKLHSSNYGRSALRRDYQHSRSYSQGSHSHSVTPRHQPYPNPTPPTPYSATRRNHPSHPGPSHSAPPPPPPPRNNYYDLASPNSQPSYSAYPAPNSPNYYPYPTPNYPTIQSNEVNAPSYPPRSSIRSDPVQRSQSLLPLPESAPHPNLIRRGSYPTNLHPDYPHRPSLQRTGSTPAMDRARNESGGGEISETGDSVKLPSLKDLGVPLR